MVTKVTFVGPGFTRKPPKYERFIHPSGLGFTKAHVTHPELKCTFKLEIIGVKKNPKGPMYISLGVMTKGTIIEVNVSELGLVTPAGKIVWGMNYLSWHGPEAHLVVTEPNLVKEIFNNKDGAFPKPEPEEYFKKLLGDGIVTTRGEKWFTLRKLSNHAFHAECLKNDSSDDCKRRDHA
ncbi:hypothetical protein GH714_029226 [Hevea brasiliensis]|uniref:Cytochrome P450 n=1 Tax=Hevea brasiliensis TaxID=3981 RepID=A0A6A6LD35_HEVBR|nr:hypothetical protein GH714_029226 [Hevea brasiliensis]